MQRATLILSDARGEQWGTWPVDMPSIPRSGEIIHFLSEESGNAVFHILFVQYNVNYKDRMGKGEDPYTHVEICEDEEPFLSGTLGRFADSLKSQGVQLHQRDQREY